MKEWSKGDRVSLRLNGRRETTGVVNSVREDGKVEVELDDKPGHYVVRHGRLLKPAPETT